MTQNRSSAVMQQRSEPHGETWRAIAGWPGYEVSDLGRVRSWKQRGPGRKWVIRTDMPPRALRPDPRNGYLSVVLCDRNIARKWRAVHHLVLEAFVGPCPEGWHGAHGDGDQTNNALANLRWATPTDNNADKVLHGTHQHGEMIGTAKLSADAVSKIRLARAARTPVRILAARYGVCRNTITNVSMGHSWRASSHGAE